jgi:hypothetical protein
MAGTSQGTRASHSSLYVQAMFSNVHCMDNPRDCQVDGVKGKGEMIDKDFYQYHLTAARRDSRLQMGDLVFYVSLITHGSLILKVSSREWRASVEYTADGKPSKARMRSCKAEREVT